MSLYQLSKLLFQLNRDDAFKLRFKVDRNAAIAAWQLTREERQAMATADIGLLYVLGVNGQILMHFAALCGIEWSDYLQLMREGVNRHGPVREGIYAMMSGVDERVAGA